MTPVYSWAFLFVVNSYIVSSFKWSIETWLALCTVKEISYPMCIQQNTPNTKEKVHSILCIPWIWRWMRCFILYQLLYIPTVSIITVCMIVKFIVSTMMTYNLISQCWNFLIFKHVNKFNHFSLGHLMNWSLLFNKIVTINWRYFQQMIYIYALENNFNI